MGLFKAADIETVDNNETTPLNVNGLKRLDKLKKNPVVASLIHLKEWYESDRLRKLRRWAALIFGSIMMVAGGTQYAFSAIGPSLKQHFDLSQTEVNLIGTAANIGNNTGFLFSLINDFIGARACSFAAGAVLFGSYFLMSLTVSGAIPGAENYIIMSAFMFLVGNSSGGTYIGFQAALTTSVKNFPEKNRGLVVGLLSSFFGISSAIFSLCFSVVFRQSLPAYMFFCAIFGAVAVLILGTIFLDNNSSSEKKVVEPIPVEFKLENERVGINGQTSDEPEMESPQPAVVETEDELNEDEIKAKLDEYPIENISSFRMLLTLDFWLIFVTIFLSIGAGITVLNNLGSIVLAYGGYNGQQTPMVIIFSVSNCIGRLAFGWLSDRFFSPKKGITRIFFLSVCVITMSISVLLFAFVPIPGFYPLIIIMGLCYGGIFSVGPAYNSERFGSKYFGMNSTLQILASSVGSYAFSTGMAGSIYQMNIRPPRTRTCHGRECYLLTFYILSGLCVVALLLSFVLHKRSLELYKKIEKRRYYLGLLENINMAKKASPVVV